MVKANQGIVEKPLSVIRRSCREVQVTQVNVETSAENKTLLFVHFDNGTVYSVVFASCSVLRQVLRRWRNIYGKPLYVNGEYVGAVGYNNDAWKD